MKKPKIPVYEAKIRETDNTGIFAMSFVEVPAVEELFVALRANAHKVTLVKNKAKQILTGVVLKPNQLIYRNDDQLGEYYLKYTAEDIERIALKMMRTGVGLKTTTHQHEAPLKGNYLTEVWLVVNPKIDKSVALGLGELPKGTLCASYKITDTKYWRDEVVTGNVKGFSLEGLFNYKNVNMKKPALTAAKTAAALAAKKPSAAVAFLKSVTAFLEGDSVAAAEGVAEVAADDETDSGEPFLIFTLADGTEIFVDEDGFATIDGEQAPAGNHTLDDGNVIVIDDAGLMVVTTDEPEEVAPEAAAAALAAAKERGNEYLAKLGKPAAKKPTPKETEIAKLKAQIAKLEKEPSAPKAKVTVLGAKSKDVDTADLKHHEKMALVIQSRLERQGK